MKYLFAFIVIIFISCEEENPKICVASKELNLPEMNSSLSQITIGRVLFYDTRLSLNNRVACASCHKQNHGFADVEAKSTGFQNQKTVRNSIAINMGNSNMLFWDGREDFLQTMVLRPLTNHVEMGMSDNDAIVDRIKGAGYYQELFSKVYGDGIIDIDRISSCLSLFVSTIRSDNSKFDQVTNGSASFTAMEERGKQLFFDVYPCGSCHTLDQGGYNSQGTLFANIGLDEVAPDPGRSAITNNQNDNGKFKVPSLRNISLSGPYMHDGRFSTLEEVLDHYSTGIKNHPNLDPRLKDTSGNPLVLEITTEQKQAMITFLSTLTDNSVLSNQFLSDPFNH